MERRIEHKYRPLLVCFECIDNKAVVVSRSYSLCHHDQYKKVFVVPDRTKIERDEQKRLVTELKKRKSQGETGLMIKNGKIIVRSRMEPQPHQSEEQL